MSRKIVILLGHPGAGKGTQSRAIMTQLSIPQISTGDMLRDAVTRQTSFGKEAKERMDMGELVSDEIVNGIVAERIRREDCAAGFILDGYPRNVPQAETFHHELKTGDRLSVIEIRAETANLVNRLVGRLMCPGCGEIYNIYSRTPQSEKVCDRCGRQLIHRSDDREDLIHERFKTYDGETFPVVSFCKGQGAYYQVDGMRPIGEVTREILAIVTAESAARAVDGGNQKFA